MYKSIHTGKQIDEAITKMLEGGGTGICRNLFRNWYFGNPVDQRGGMICLRDTPAYSDPACTVPSNTTANVADALQMVSTGNYKLLNIDFDAYVKAEDAVRGYTGAGYTIDRWKIYASGTVLCTDGGIRLVNVLDWGTQIENYRVPTNTPITISVLTETGIGFVTHSFSGQANEQVYRDLGNGVTINFLRDWANTGTALMALQAGDAVVKAAKLELGDTQTLAHQDENGKWVLNEIPDKDMELLKCQRCYEVTAWHCGFGIAGNTNYIDLVSSYFYKVQKRAHPQVTINTANPNKPVVTKVSGGTSVADAEVAQQTAWNTYMIAPRIYSPSGAFVKGELYRVILPDNAYFINSDL